MLKEISSRVLGPLFATMFGLSLLVLMPINPGDHKEYVAMPKSDKLSTESQEQNVDSISQEIVERDSTRTGYSFGVDSINEEKAD